MKNTRLAIALAALTTSAGLALAQNDDMIRERIPVPPSPPEAPAEVVAGHAAQLAASQNQMKQAERALAASQNAMQVAQAQAGEALARAPKAISIGGVRNASAGRALIIPKSPAAPKDLAEAEEDMNVMAHILDKAVSEDRKSGRAMGIPVLGRFSWGATTPQNLLIEGSGALFFLNVNYPLQPAPDKDAAPETKEKPASEWEIAKKEMAGPRGGSDNLLAFGGSFEHSFVWDSSPSAPYDAEKIEDLKADLTAALKNAANIRRLNADDAVTVIVTGSSASPGSKTLKGKTDEEAARLRGRYGLDAKVVDLTPAPAKLVLRVRKADAESFQNGRLDPDDFKKKVTVMVY
jgi:hypothetical protein